jgi:retron-type reverse transcriptase
MLHDPYYYFAVLSIEIPKAKKGGCMVLGIPTIKDRHVLTAVKMLIIF